MVLSIITVNYNNAEGLKRTLQSCSKINCLFELIIIDGKSTDRSLDSINTFTFNNLIVVSEKDKGIYDAMNKGIQLAKGDWINFMNSGDVFFDVNDLEQILEENKSRDLIYGDKMFEGQLFKASNIILLKWGIIHACHQSMFFNKKRLRKQLHYNLFYKIYADYELVNRLYKQGAQFRYINRAFSQTEPGGISQKITLRKRIEKLIILLINYGFVNTIKAYIKSKKHHSNER